MSLYVFRKDIIDNLLKVISNCTEKSKIPVIYGYIIIVIVFVILLSILSYLIWHLKSKIHINEVTVADKATAKFGAQNENAIFNKNMDEIVYFFEETKYSYVFIEDLDRFDNLNIFVKLRELNIILNICDSINRKIVFIYAIKDDMFSNCNRTKFFEYILPVIPIINSTNSGEVLLERINNDIKSGNLNDTDIDSDYVLLMSPYVDDMRILNNTYNEFLLYRRLLKEQQGIIIRDTKLFVLILFKNLYPKEFSDLQAETGIIKEAFVIKDDAKKTINIEYETEKKELSDKIICAEKEILNGLREVKELMLAYMAEEDSIFTRISINNHTISKAQILEKSFDVNILKGKGTVYFRKSGYEHSKPFDGKSAFIGEHDYVKRCDNIIYKEKDKREQLQKEIEDLESHVKEIDSYSLKQIIDKCGSNVLPEKCHQNKFLVFLLSQGFIDETYTDYMNYFYPNSISTMDKNFIIGIRAHEKYEYSYNLNRVDQVIKFLLPYEFDNKELYNYDLMDGLLSKEEYKEKRDKIIINMSQNIEENWQFIDGYLEKSKYPEKFMKELCGKCGDVWEYVYNNELLTDEHKDKYVSYICCLDEKIWKKQNRSGMINKYFTENEDSLQRMASVPDSNIINLIQYCEIVFYNLNIEGVSNVILEWIFENGYYENNLNMLQCIFKYKTGKENEYLLMRNYTEVLELKYMPLILHIKENFEEYIENIVLGLPNNKDEKIEAILQMIENQIPVDKILNIIEKENALLDNLRSCKYNYLKDDNNSYITVWQKWLQENKVKATWDNIETYWSSCGIDNVLCDFIHWNDEILINEEMPNNIDSSFTKELIMSELEKESFKKIIQFLPKISCEDIIPDINSEHLKVLIQLAYFKFEPVVAKSILINHSSVYSASLIAYKNMIIDNKDDYEVRVEDLDVIIECNSLSEKEKIKFIENSDVEEFDNKISLYLKDVKTKISKRTFFKAWECLNEQDKYELFINQISVLDIADISDCFKALSVDYQRFADTSRRHEEELYDTSYNRRLMDHLEKIEYITSQYTKEKKYYNSEKKKVIDVNVLVGRIKKR